MSDAYQNTPRISSNEWRMIASRLKDKGEPLEHLFPIQHAGQTCTVPDLGCGRCGAPLPAKAFTAVIDAPHGSSGPLIVHAAAKCPHCKKTTLWRNFYGPRAIGTQPHPFDLVAAARRLSKRRGETELGRHAPLIKRAFARVHMLDTWLTLGIFINAVIVMHLMQPWSNQDALTVIV